MLDRLRQLLVDLTRPEPGEREVSARQSRLAAAALLVHVAEIDGMFTSVERRALLLLLQQRYDLDEDSAQKLIAAAQRKDHESVDLFSFTSVLQHALSQPERRRLVEMMWTVAYADGVATEFEENIIWRVSGLLNVPERDCVALRQKVRADSGRDPFAPAPWDAADSTEKGDS